MERNGDGSVETVDMAPLPGDNSALQFEQRSVVSSNVCLDHVGEVVLSLNSNGLSWKSAKDVGNELDASSCLGFSSRVETEIKFSDIYAVESISWGKINESIFPSTGDCLLGRDSQMYRFVVHGFQRSKTKNSPWVLAEYTFGHKDVQTCQAWVEQINTYLSMQAGRPKSLLVFVHPLSGKGTGRRTWQTVSPIFSRAKVRTKVIVTERSGHAFDVMASVTDQELNTYDGIIAVGGDGFFNEVLNGLLSPRHKAPYPPVPKEFMHSTGNNEWYNEQRSFGFSNNGGSSDHDPNDCGTEALQNEDHSPLLPSSEATASGLSNFRTRKRPCNPDAERASQFAIPNEWFRLGIIPSGSTDAIVICTTGARDPVTSALQIVLGKRVSLDIAQVVRWKTSPSSTHGPSIRYAASFAGYGFYGDVIKESENYRWMGPKRYDYAGTKVFLKHRSYEAEVAFLEVQAATPVTRRGFLNNWQQRVRRSPENAEKVICRANCVICNEATKTSHMLANDSSTTSHIQPEEARWSRSKGRYLSVGAAIISCRNEKAPDGLVADAHLADGFLHLILIKDCPRSLYLWHLTELTRKGAEPLNFDFVEHHKTPAFTFTTTSDESVWNLDGEVFQACQLSAQVFRGLVSLFASGPET